MKSDKLYEAKCFSKNLRKLRKAQGYNQSELANKIGIKREMIGHLETGNSKPTFNNLIKIHLFFGVSLDDLCLKELQLEIIVVK